MHLKKLRARFFRNLENLNVELGEQVNVFLGSNGQGKTNILEAVFFLSRGSSFRQGKIDSFLLQSPEFSTGEAKISGGLVKNSLESKVEVLFRNNRRACFVDEKKISTAGLSRQVPVVLFSPESLAAIKEGPEQRRRLLDELILSVQPEQSHLLESFNRCLKSRNRILKDFVQNRIDRSETEKLLECINPRFLSEASRLCSLRIDALNQLQQEFQRAFLEINGNRKFRVKAQYQMSENVVVDSAVQTLHDALLKRLQTLHTAELAVGTSLLGPHKHDVLFEFEGNNARFYCSQGQQRAIILAFKLAQIVYHQRTQGFFPILLLDDVMSELDTDKQMNLTRLLMEMKAQILITSTDLAVCDRLKSQNMKIFDVNSGQLMESQLANVRNV